MVDGLRKHDRHVILCLKRNENRGKSGCENTLRATKHLAIRCYAIFSRKKVNEFYAKVWLHTQQLQRTKREGSVIEITLLEDCSKSC